MKAHAQLVEPLCMHGVGSSCNSRMYVCVGVDAPKALQEDLGDGEVAAKRHVMEERQDGNTDTKDDTPRKDTPIISEDGSYVITYIRCCVVL